MRPAPDSAMLRGPSWRRRTAPSTSTAPSPITSRWKRDTSGRSRRISAICCSTSSSSGRSTPPRDSGWVEKLAGEVFHGPALVSGGTRAEARGILETKREIKELRDRIAVERGALTRLAQETTELEAAIAQASNAITALDAEHHKHEKAIVGYESQLQHARDEETRLAQRAAQLVRERRQSEEERDALDRRRAEARASIARLENDQRLADERLTVAQRRLFEARESIDDSSRRAAEAGAAHAALVERASALAAEVQRLEEAAAEIEARAASLAIELEESRSRVRQLRESIAAGERQLDADVRGLGDLRRAVMSADERVAP